MLFKSATVRLTDLHAPVRTLKYGGLRKSEFLDPEIESRSSNYLQVFASQAADCLLNPLWTDFLSIPAETVTLRSKPDTLRFWRTVQARAAALGEEYIVILSDKAQAIFERRWPLGEQTQELELAYERDQDRRTYRRTVAGRRVHEVTFGKPMEAFLVPSDLLESVFYGRLNNGKAVDAEWLSDSASPGLGSVRLQYAPLYTWRAAKIVRIRFLD